MVPMQSAVGRRWAVCAVLLAFCSHPLLTAVANAEVVGSTKHFIPFKDGGFYFPTVFNSFVQESEESVPEAMTMRGLPASHSCVCMDMSGMASGSVVPVFPMPELDEETSNKIKEKAQELEAVKASLRQQAQAKGMDVNSMEFTEQDDPSTQDPGKKVQMVCYCGKKGDDGAADLGSLETTVADKLQPITGESYDYLRPFTHRLFDRHYGADTYDGPKYEELWNDHDRFQGAFGTDPKDKADADFDEKYVNDQEGTGKAVDNFLGPQMDEVSPLPRLDMDSKSLLDGHTEVERAAIQVPVDEAEKHADAIAEEATKSLMELTLKPVNATATERDATSDCDQLKEEHMELYKTMRGFFGHSVTLKQCDFWKQVMAKMHSTLKLELSPKQSNNFNQILHCLC